MDRNVDRYMKRILLFLSSLLLAISTLFVVGPVLAEGTNLIANPNAEITSGTSPANWQQSKWGTNTGAHAYNNPGASGSRSLEVSLTAHTDGDIKWMHDAVAIKPNTEYVYTSWYASGVSTEIDLQYIDTAGITTYAYVSAIDPNTTGQNLSVKFKTPANAAKVSVMHVLARVGTLETDNFTLSAADTSVIDNDNLIANGSFESLNGTLPAHWTRNSWGTNQSQFSYETSGRTGSRSAKVSMTSYTNGDAKWYADAATVTSGKSYTYRDYYKSSVSTRVVVAYISATGAYSYEELALAPASIDTWKEYSATFTAPATAVKASVYHILASVGHLTIDDASLYVALPPPTGPSVPNSSLETSIGTTPANWQKSSWGANTSTFEYLNSGYTGNRSVKVTVANYQDGDAKWYFDPITTMQPGKQYRFTAWYKTNVTPHPVAMFTMADGTTQYFGMPIAQPASNSSTVWQKYTDTFSVPAGAVSGSVFLFINQNGWLQTDDYSLTPYSPNGFTRPLLTITFDDGHEENATTALPVLNQYGLKTTQCFATSFIEGQSQAVKNGVLAFKNSGHEICSHTVTHPFLTSTNASSLTYELQHSQKYLKSLTGQAVRNFASPYGDYDARVITEIKKYYRSHRSVDEGYNSKDNFNIYSLRVQNVLDTTSAQQITAWINQAKIDKTWLILVYHRVADDPGPYDTYKNVFVEHVQAIKSSGIAVKTYNSALDEVTPQL